MAPKHAGKAWGVRDRRGAGGLRRGGARPLGVVRLAGVVALSAGALASWGDTPPGGREEREVAVESSQPSGGAEQGEQHWCTIASARLGEDRASVVGASGTSAEAATTRSVLLAARAAVDASLGLIPGAESSGWLGARGRLEDTDAEASDTFDALTAMLASLGDDAGLWVRTTDGRRWSSGGHGGHRHDETDAARRDRTLSSLTQLEQTEHLIAGRLGDGTTYLAVGAVTGGAPRTATEDADAVLGSMLDKLAQLGPGEAVVIDLRSGGRRLGVTQALVLATCLGMEDGAAFLEQRAEPNTGMLGVPTPAVVSGITSTGTGPRPKVSGPVVLLVGLGTEGGGEALVLATMSSPRVTRIGNRTEGDLTLGRVVRLPNGWRMGVPGRRLLAWDGRSFDGVGIPPHIAAPDARGAGPLPTGQDPALREALGYLDRLRRSGLLPGR